jgi:putative nucleotidyltransferase with HDIG domain
MRMSEVIGAMSFALDVTDGQPEGHSLRSCMIGMRLVRELGLGPAEQAAAFYGLLVKDAGCSSNAAAVAALYGTDDLVAKHALRTVNYSRLSEAIGYIVGNVGGARDLLRVARAGKETARAMTEIRCERGAEIAQMLELPDGAAQAIGALGEHWDGKGHPLGLRGEEIPLLARVFKLAQTAEVFVRDFGVDAACEMAVARSGSWFDPGLVDVLLGIRRDTGFWSSLVLDLQEAIDTVEPEDRRLVADDARLDRVAEAFALVVDAKSPYTSTHSARVAQLAVATGAELGLSKAQLRDLRRAGLLHDIGKLAVPNTILDKPGSLTPEERRQIERHPQLSAEVLGRVPAFSAIAEVAAAHHERLDGSGYTRGLTSKELSVPQRILAVADVFEALTADRPYRRAMPADIAFALVRDEVAKGRLCGDAASALARGIERGDELIAA